MPSSAVTMSFNGPSDNCTKNTAGPQWMQYSINQTYGVGTPPVLTQQCSVRFSIPVDLNPPVLFYYRLTNFYQNHRRYVKSLDTDQLKGKPVAGSACAPLQNDPKGKPYYPCGLIANSQFNDTFTNPLQLNLHDDSSANRTYNMSNSDIAWSSDASLYSATKYDYSAISPPPNWFLQYQNGYSTENPPPDLHHDQEFQVWMRTAGLPAFSKLAKKNTNEIMQCSVYQIDISNSKLQ